MHPKPKGKSSKGVAKKEEKAEEQELDKSDKEEFEEEEEEKAEKAEKADRRGKARQPLPASSFNSQLKQTTEAKEALDYDEKISDDEERLSSDHVVPYQ